MSDLAFLRSKQLFAGEEAQVENSQCLGCLWAAQTGARSRDLGYGCYSAATWGSPRMPAGLGCIPGELCAGSGVSQVADTVLGSDMCTESPWLCRAGAELLPQGLMLWDAPAPSSVSGDASGMPLLPPLSLGTPLQPWARFCPQGVTAALCSSCWPQGKCTCMFPQGTRWPLGLQPPLPQTTVANGDTQQCYRCHSSGDTSLQQGLVQPPPG